MSMLVNGMSVVTAGLDHWFPEGDTNLDLSEYTEHDWRLEARLRVKKFRLPPDYRFRSDGNDPRNLRLTIPVLRFPRWHFCLYCKRLETVPLTMRTQVQCQDAKHTGDRKPRMSQVPIVAICAHGHLDDFPFDKWVHRSHSPSCTGTLRLESYGGGGGLEGQVVTCDGCDRTRSLNGIMDSRPGAGGEDRTTLTDSLSSPDDPFWCPGSRPWLGEFGGGCGQPVRGALRAAGNVYFPKVESSIYLPRKEGAVSAELHDLMRDQRVGPMLKMMHDMHGKMGMVTTADALRKVLPYELFAPISDEQLLAGFADFTGAGADQPAEQPAGSDALSGSDEWRHPEFLVIREAPKDDYLSGTNPGIHPDLAGLFDRVRSIDVLRETRALRGFTRVRDDDLRLNVGKAMLRRTSLPPEHDWLPAYVVKGEGIYLELGADRLAKWESRAEVRARADKLAAHYRGIASQRGLQDRALSPRLILIHTLGHLLINELVFTCGYSSASLRERLYVSDTPGREMAGILIYTAAGDSEGTMGGLVRMSRSDSLRQVITSALDDARWCSSDPVCMDAGEKGQGPDSCNLAACHGCALLPETSCEEFNRFLDRGLVIGTFNDPGLGFFSD
jgi:hypothetical protein